MKDWQDSGAFLDLEQGSVQEPRGTLDASGKTRRKALTSFVIARNATNNQMLGVFTQRARCSFTLVCVVRRQRPKTLQMLAWLLFPVFI